MSAAILSSEHLSKWYGQVIGLNDVTVSVPPGITGLLGPNGAGKSTFMKLITGQLRPSKGGVTVLGEPIWRNPKLYFRVGFCPEQDAFYERMTGLEWVTALVRLNGYSEKEAADAAEKAMTTVDLMDAANKKIGAYSKGMRQRVKLAQAIVHDPEMLILDEPLSGMDPLARRRTMKMIREWARQGKSVLVSSHILHEVESMTSNILLINNGRILAEGNVHQIGSPSTRIVPWLGLSWPVISFMNVDLPAPLGPSRPVMPGGIDTVTLFSPLTCPYHLETPSA